MPFYASEFVGHHPGAPDWIGLESVKLIVRMTRDAFPDFTETIEDVVAEADRVVTRFTSTGTHLGALRGLAPTGRRIWMAEMAIFHGRRNEVLPGHGMRRSPAFRSRSSPGSTSRRPVPI
jgi:predicted ester cyclase